MFAPVAKLLAIAILAAGPVRATELKVLSSPAVREAFTEIVPRFEAASGHKVVPAWGSTPNIAARIAGGEAVDVVIIGAADIDKLIADGKLLADGRADVAKSGIGIAVRAGLPKPDISTVDSVTKAVLDARSIATSSGVSGLYVIGLFEKMGIWDRIKGKVTRTPSGVIVGDVMLRGDADLGFQQISELIHVRGIDYLGPLPAEIQRFTIFSAAPAKATAMPDEARALIRALTAPDAAPIYRRFGMEPS